MDFFLLAIAIAIIVIVVALLAYRLGQASVQPTIAGLNAALEYERKQDGTAEAQFTKIANDVLTNTQNNLLALAAERYDAQRTEAGSDLDQRRQAIELLVLPMRESLGELNEHVVSLEKARRQAYGELAEQVRGMNERADTLRAETSGLKEALRTSGTRGRWGEMQLRRIVEYAGMIEYCDFDEQATTTDHSGKQQRPDLVVRLTGGRSIAVDSKAPMQGYLNAMEATTETVRKQCLADHAKAVRGHVKVLSDKGYWKALDPAPDFTVMFVPGEPFLRAALESDPELLEYALEQQVVLTTPTMLVALLRTVAYGWRQDQFSAQAREVYDQARELLLRLHTLHDNFSNVGKTLDGAVKAYNSAVGTMEGRVLPQARKIADLGVTADALQPVKEIEREPRELNPSKWRRGA